MNIRIDVKLTSRALLIYLVEQPEAQSYEAFAEYMSCARATVGRHIRRLKAAGYVEVVYRDRRALYIPTEAGREAIAKYVRVS